MLINNLDRNREQISELKDNKECFSQIIDQKDGQEK